MSKNNKELPHEKTGIFNSMKNRLKGHDSKEDHKKQELERKKKQELESKEQALKREKLERECTAEDSAWQKKSLLEEKLKTFDKNAKICGVEINGNKTENIFPFLTTTRETVYHNLDTNWKDKSNGHTTEDEITWYRDFAKILFIIAQLHEELDKIKEVDGALLLVKFQDFNMNQITLFLIIMEYDQNSNIIKPVRKTIKQYIKSNPNWIDAIDQNLEIYKDCMLPIIKEKYMSKNVKSTEISSPIDIFDQTDAETTASSSTLDSNEVVSIGKCATHDLPPSD